MVDVVPTSAPLLAGGQAKAYFVTMPTRAPQLPEVPTSAEAGVGELDMGSWMALLAPRGTPAPVVAALNGALNDALAEPATRDRLVASGAVPMGGTAAALAARVASESRLWADLIRAGNIQVE
jgi:tripartite-type tricarboxylate transporter receptor subunit TctC